MQVHIREGVDGEKGLPQLVTVYYKPTLWCADDRVCEPVSGGQEDGAQRGEGQLAMLLDNAAYRNCSVLAPGSGLAIDRPPGPGRPPAGRKHALSGLPQEAARPQPDPPSNLRSDAMEALLCVRDGHRGRFKGHANPQTPISEALNCLTAGHLPPCM